MVLPDEQMKAVLQAIEVLHHPAHGDYVRLYDIPQPWRDVFHAYAQQREAVELPYIWSEQGPHERGWLWQAWLSLVLHDEAVPATTTVPSLDDAYLEQWRARREAAQTERRGMCVLRPRGKL